MSEGSATSPEAAGPDENPWPGLASYTEDQRHLFFGRTTEINEVVRLVGRETLTVLFGRSGLGKSSLLRAGVMPRLREGGFFPVTLRLDFSERGEISPVEQVKALAVAAARQAGIAVEGMPDDEAGLTLWEWFHTVEFWGPRNDPVTPILALDQFEEVFTLGRGLPPTEDFIEQLADLIENRVPQSLRNRAEKGRERLAYDAARQTCKVILSLREDFVAKLDSLRPVLPAIMRNRFALAPLDAECACAVVLGAGRTWVSDPDARVIVAAVVGGSEVADSTAPRMYRPDEAVEPAYLSVMCHELFRRMQALGRNAITRDLVVAERGGILEGLYTRSFEGIGDPVRFFVEDRLLTPSGFRGTLPLADATQEGIAEADLHKLVDRRLLRFEDRLGTIHLELSHDLLTRIVLRRRESRRTEAALKLETERARKLRVAQLAQRRRSRFVVGVAVALACLLLGTVWGGYYCFLQEHQAFFRDVGRRRGFPAGFGQLSAAQARRLPLHYVLVYQGIRWDGWRPHWKPPFRLMAMDQGNRLTTSHGIGTFLWRAQDEWQPAKLDRDRGVSLGLGAVCQWEYVSDAHGTIAYERGLDRSGRMVYACVFSPTASGGSSARIAHYVGPDGFPQLQNKSAAEYVEIHYNADGWEERILYQDALARPAVGPEGTFGVAKEYDSLGRLTSARALNEHGETMIDRLGTAGLRQVFDKNGFVTEIVAFGIDGKITAVKDGWARLRLGYDELGRGVLMRAFDAGDQPVIRASNFSGIGSRYGDNGALVSETFLGTDGQPMPVSAEAVSIKHEYDGEGNEVRLTFLDRAGRPTRGRDGSCGYESSYDARQDLVSRTVFGADLKPFLLADGFAGWKSEFDEAGRETRRTFHGVSGEPVLAKDGFHGWEYRYDARGNAIRYTYLGLDGKPAFTTGQIAGWEAGFDPRGREISRRYFGPDGEPVLYADGNHGYVTSYDERGYEAETTYTDLGGKPFMLSDGYATFRLEHDSQGRETKKAFFDAAGKAATLTDGRHGIFSKYDERGNVIELTTINPAGKPVDTSTGGYATERRKYDLHGNVSERRFFGADGKPASNADGVTVIRKAYTVQGWLTEESYFGVDDQPARDKAGMHRQVSEYDFVGNLARTSMFGLKGEPVPGASKACSGTYRYDERNNEIETALLGPDGKPTSGSGGYAIVRARFDARNNQTETIYFGVDGLPCLAADKTHRVIMTYDDRRRIVRYDYRGTRDEPVVGTGGYAAIEADYDARGNVTRKAFLGVDGKPVALPAGYASFRQSFSPAGQLTRTDYYGANNEKALNENGVCSYRADYDENGLLAARTWGGLPGLTASQTASETDIDGLKRSERYLDADGRLVNNALGYAQADFDRDESGAMIRGLYRAADGKPAYGEGGYAGSELVAKSWKYYDAAGQDMEDVEHDGVRPLMYLVYLRSNDCVAAKSGFLPGDIIWQMGRFFFPSAVDGFWKTDRNVETFRTHVYATWSEAFKAPVPTPMLVVVIRAGKMVELSIPTVPDGGIGVRVNVRCVPTGDYEAMIGQPGFSVPAQ